VDGNDSMDVGSSTVMVIEDEDDGYTDLDGFIAQN
jgi:hypothetical protein